MNVVKEIQRINEKEALLGLSGKASWHDKYKDSAYVFVGGLDYGLTEGDVICVFSQYGEIVDIHLVRDKSTGRSKGFAFICYEDQRSTILAVDNFNGAQLCGRTLRVDHVDKYKTPKEEVKKEYEEALKEFQKKEKKELKRKEKEARKQEKQKKKENKEKKHQQEQQEFENALKRAIQQKKEEATQQGVSKSDSTTPPALHETEKPLATPAEQKKHDTSPSRQRSTGTTPPRQRSTERDNRPNRYREDRHRDYRDRDDRGRRDRDDHHHRYDSHREDRHRDDTKRQRVT